MPKSRKRRDAHAPSRAPRTRRLLPYPGAAQARVRHLPQPGCRHARRHRTCRRAACQRLLGHAEMADRQERRRIASASNWSPTAWPRRRCSASSARCRAISAATASSPSRAARSRRAKSRRRRCGARNSPTSRRRRPRCASGGGRKHDPQAGGGKYRLYSRKKNPRTGKRRNLGTFTSRKAAEKHERDVQYFKRH